MGQKDNEQSKQLNTTKKSDDEPKEKTSVGDGLVACIRLFCSVILLICEIAESASDLVKMVKWLTITAARVLVCVVIAYVIWIYLPFNNTAPSQPSKTETEWLPVDWTLIDQDDQRLIDFIKKNHLLPPSTEDYHLKDPDVVDHSQNGQSEFIDQLLQHKKEGVFIEAGAYDGEYLSNSLFFEKSRGWTGLLVEPDPWNHYSLLKRNRKAYTIHAGLSTSRHLMRARFKQSGEAGRIAKEEEMRGIFTQVTFFPLFSLMMSIGRTRIDILFLDIEGAELQVLKTIPWVQVSIQVICVEYKHNPNEGGGLKPYLEGLGYKFIKTIGHDHIFQKRNDNKEIE